MSYCPRRTFFAQLPIEDGVTGPKKWESARLLKHYWRDNSVSGLPWHGPIAEFGVTNEFSPDIASMIESNYGNLEVVARFTVPSFVKQRITTKELYHFFRDANGWHGPNFIVTQP